MNENGYRPDSVPRPFSQRCRGFLLHRRGFLTLLVFLALLIVPLAGVPDPPSDLNCEVINGDVILDWTSPLVQTYREKVVALSPVAYWRLGESSGTTAADETGNHDGSYQNVVTLGQPGVLTGDPNTAASFYRSQESKRPVTRRVRMSGRIPKSSQRDPSHGKVRSISRTG